MSDALLLRCPGCAAAWSWEPAAPNGETPAPAGSSDAASGAGDAAAASPEREARCPSCDLVLTERGGILDLDAESGEDEYPAALAASDAALDGDHWWYASRTDVLLRVLRPWQRRRGRAGLAFDLGCGSGLVLAAAEREGWRGVGLDMQRPALETARRRVRGALLRSGRAAVPLAEPVDLALLCDVLEHGDEAELLTPLREALAPDGALLLTVPARPSLWSLEDVAVGHRRRYTAASLRECLRAQGFAPRVLRGFHAWMTPLAWRAARRAGPPPERAEALERFLAGRRAPSPRASRVFGALCAAENAVGARLPLPWASHLVALAERA